MQNALPMSSTTFWMINLRFHKKWLFVPFLLTGSDFNVPIAALSGALRRSSSKWCSWWEWEWRGWCWDWSGCWKGEDVEGPHSFTQQCPHGAKIYGWWFQWVKADGCDGNPNQFYAGKVGKPYGALPSNSSVPCQTVEPVEPKMEVHPDTPTSPTATPTRAEEIKHRIQQLKEAMKFLVCFS